MEPTFYENNGFWFWRILCGDMLWESAPQSLRTQEDAQEHYVKHGPRNTLPHALMRASIAEGNVKVLEAENARLRAELDRVVAML